MKTSISVILFFIVALANAQKVAFTGYGRARVLNETLKGNLTNGDTTSPKRGTDGDMVFDVGMHFQPYDYFRVKALLRLKNKFGSFYGQGASVEFRQILVEGLISQRVKYSLGDIDLQVTPYTVFNNADTTAYEADVFKVRRDIIHYDNFNVGNQWRVQGAKANAIFNINKSSSNINFAGFATRTRPTTNNTKPDRFLIGATADGNLGKSLTLGANLVSFFEMPNQLDTTSYHVNVFTGTAKYLKESKKLDFGFDVEAGLSKYTKTYGTDSVYSFGDMFYDLKGVLKIKPLLARLTAGYKNVGYNFTSPAAQTLRIDATRNPNLFTSVQNNTAVRQQIVYDRLTDASLYNVSISPTLMTYLPQYSNVLPYGAATPNRVGFTGKLELGGAEKAYAATLEAYKLNEIKADTLDAKRNFLLLQGGVSLKINKLIGINRIFNLSAGIKHESTQREKPAISLKSNQLDFGLTIETIKNLDLIFGYKLISASGNEYVKTYNERYRLVSQVATQMDFVQFVASPSIRYRFTEKSFFNISGNFVNVKNNSNNKLSYKISQYFITYVLQF